MRAGQVGTKISRDLPAGRLRLASALVELHRHTGAVTLAATARLFDEHGYRTNRDAISRYLNGRRVPPLRFVTLLHELAVAGAGSETAVGLTRGDAVKAHERAEPTLCKTCPTLRSDNNNLREQNRQLKESQAGLAQALATARRRATPLPVPLRKGDRQRQTSDVAGARQIANVAARLRDQGKTDAALAILVDTVGTLTPLEGAASLAALRTQQQAQLADTLVHMYGREHSEKEVIQAALELHEHGLPDDAVAILRTAVR